MKLTIENDGTELVVRAETQEDLDFIEKMEGVFEPGPWYGADFQCVKPADLGFDHGEAGKRLFIGGEITKVMAIVRLKLDWLSYAEPKTPEQILRANTAARIGYSLLDGFKLACAKP